MNFNIIENIYDYINAPEKFGFIKSVLSQEDYEYAVKHWKIDDRAVDLIYADTHILHRLTYYSRDDTENYSPKVNYSFQHEAIINYGNVINFIVDTIMVWEKFDKVSSHTKNKLCQNIRWLSYRFSIDNKGTCTILSSLLIKKYYDMYNQLKFEYVSIADLHHILFAITPLEKTYGINTNETINILDYLHIEKSNITDNLLVSLSICNKWNVCLDIMTKYNYTYSDLSKKIDDNHTILTSMLAPRYCLYNNIKCNNIYLDIGSGKKSERLCFMKYMDSDVSDNMREMMLQKVIYGQKENTDICKIFTILARNSKDDPNYLKDPILHL